MLLCMVIVRKTKLRRRVCSRDSKGEDEREGEDKEYLISYILTSIVEDNIIY